jgi:hypothetical protein
LRLFHTSCVPCNGTGSNLFHDSTKPAYAISQTINALQQIETVYMKGEFFKQGIFDKPADAVVVEQEVDCMVDPDSGLIADGMTREEACLAIVQQTGQSETRNAMIKFYQLEGKTLCFIIGSKEKGVVD